jgi:hypothetical protein
MSTDHTPLDALHEATHRLPGTPPHPDHPTGHQGTAYHGQSVPNRAHHGSVPAHDRPRRMLVGWQNWIAGRFSRTTD